MDNQEIIEMPNGQLAIASAIDQTHYQIQSITHDNKQRKEMLDAIYAENEDLTQVELELNQLKKNRKDILNKLNEDQRVINLDGQIRAAKEELKALKKKQAIELLSYVEKNKTNRISLSDGDYIISRDAKLKKEGNDD